MYTHILLNQFKKKKIREIEFTNLTLTKSLTRSRVVQNTKNLNSNQEQLIVSRRKSSVHFVDLKNQTNKKYYIL